MKKIFVTDIKDYVGDRIQEKFYFTRLGKTASMKKNEIFYDVELTDKTGKHIARLWTEDYANYERFVDSVVEITGNITVFNGEPVIQIKDMFQTKEYDLNDYVARLSDEKTNLYIHKINEFIEKVEDPGYKALLNNFFTPGRLKALAKTPCTKTSHHSYNGGTLEHTIEVAELALSSLDVHQSHTKNYSVNLNKDLIITAALLHDIGKLTEYEPYPKCNKTERGVLVGHLVDAALTVTMINNGLDDKVKIKNTTYLVHCILASHGNNGYIKPGIPEAYILANANYTSITIDKYGSMIEHYNLKHPSDGNKFIRDDGMCILNTYVEEQIE